MTTAGRVLRARLPSLLLCALAIDGCRSKPQQQPPPAQPRVVYHTLGTWSGRGNRQTESFTSDTGTLRVKWHATAIEDAAGSGRGASRGRSGPIPPSFKLDAHSAISGRLLQTVVDKGGPGEGTGYVQQDPHVFYMVVEATGVNWTFTVEEAIGYP